MKSILLVLLASAAFSQTAPPTPPVTPVTVTPEDAPLPVKKTRGAASELEGVNSREDGVMSLGKYEGGSWQAKPNRITAYVNRKEIVLVENKQRFAIAVKDVTGVLYGSAAQTRVGQDAGIDALKAGSKKSSGSLTDVGITWTSAGRTSGIVLKIDKGDFDNCMNALETVTGIKPINTDTKSR